MRSRRAIDRFKLLLSYDPGRVTLVVVTSVFIAAAALADPWLRKLAIDRGMLAGDQAYLLRIVGILLVIHLAQTVGGYFQAGAVNWLGQSALNRLRIETFSHLQRSVELYPNFREQARTDNDFAAVRDDPRFEEALR